jgi:tetratricopeptide (TPR) repeat protein
LSLALILRRVESHLGILAQVTPSGDPMSPPEALADAVELSLTHDPDDRDSYELLVRYHMRARDLKSARRLLDRGLERFPADAGLLTAALDLSLEANSFKKATRYAREILAIDPINTGARERLVKAHLAHARKQIRAGRLDLARKELTQAAEWEPKTGQGGRPAERRELLGALLDMARDPARGREVLGEQVRALGGGISAAFALAVECEACGHPVASALKIVGLSKIPAPNQAGLSAFLARLRAHLDEDARLTPQIRHLIQKPLSLAARWPLPQSECEGACETLRRAGLSRARQAFAEAALRRWPGTPVFLLHVFEARQDTGPCYPTSADLDRLDAALERARGMGDHRTAHRISEIMMNFGPFGLPPPVRGWAPEVHFDEDAVDVDLGEAGIDPEQALRIFIDLMGVDRLLDMMGLSGKDRKQFKALERREGRAAVIDVLMDLMRENLPDFANGPLPDLSGDPLPRPLPTPKAPTKGSPRATPIPPTPGRTRVERPGAGPRGGAGKSAGKGGGKEPGPDDPPAEGPDQLELF